MTQHIRDLSMIHGGPKRRYTAYPYTREALVNLRDLAMTDAQLANVARIADEFDSEDRIYVLASKSLRRLLFTLAHEAEIAARMKGVQP